jgi:hypothetical protein
MDQLVPSQASTRVLPLFPPTAVQLVGERQEMPHKKLSFPDSAGNELTVQFVPFHSSASAFMVCDVLPTAMQNDGDVHETPTNRSFAETSSLGTMDQLVPFHFSAWVDDEPPTAMQNVGETHETPPREIALGLETTDQAGGCAEAGALSRATGDAANTVMSSPTLAARRRSIIGLLLPQ